jgi:16S rRNA (cytosine967-C5)-methyltransferase
MTARETALLVLQEIETRDIKSDLALHRRLHLSKLGRNDRALVTELVNGTLKFRLQSDFIIRKFYHHDYDRAAPVLKNILRLGIYQLLHLDRIPRSAAVNECVKLSRKYKGDHLARLTNGLLRKISPETVDLESWTGDLPLSEQMSIRHSHQSWSIGRWLEHYGREKTEAMLMYNNLPPLTGFRINSIRTHEDALFSMPGFSGIEHHDAGLERFFFSREFSMLEPLLHEGLVSIQNPTQGLACLLIDPQPGWTVYDMCAAPGGKSTFMAQLMNNTGSIIALDLYHNKLEKLETNAAALGISIITCRVGDARSYDPGCRPDSILLDAPCTGTGVLGRRAELRWKLTREHLLELTAIQASLLDRAAELLNPGGILVYATCSIEPEENIGQIDAFLRRHPDFRQDCHPERIGERFSRHLTPDGSILTLPGDHEGFDGGFAQRLRKTAG